MSPKNKTTICRQVEIITVFIILSAIQFLPQLIAVYVRFYQTELLRILRIIHIVCSTNSKAASIF